MALEPAGPGADSSVEPSISRPAVERAKQHVARTLACDAEQLVRLSERLHANPETAWEEHRAAGWVAELLDEAGFVVTPAYLGLDTAFLATYGTGPFRLGLCAEYDALPGLGHACGHNLIAAITVGAARSLAALADDAGLTVEVYGTPAEEGGGGKIELLERGAFAGLDLAMLAHPAPVDIAEAEALAVSHSHVAFTGRAAHAAAFPEQGINAADAFTVAQVAIGLLRQHLPQTVRVHGVVTDGGVAPNAVPDRTEGRWYVRAERLEALAEVERRVWHCFEAGALATGCTVEVTPESKPYAEFRTFEPAQRAYVANAARLGRRFDQDSPGRRMNRASTDMGNVSQAVPAIHPYIGIDSLPALNHQPEFAAHCVGPAAERALLDAATALAWTALDVATGETIAPAATPDSCH
ncbi:amidohydrolase [Acidimicrobiaceae bacterium USS-CC1]|uniref:Peptidase M20 domain-containing protein 2 n=1 Tax=Acidiferrimicrobium australe TaxID=2664430 RepID=A0ABW9QPB5_9ACTN|nr:amidohydrolase [Acidiferrimicrobium australe]